MPNFIYNNSTLPIDKINLGPLPPGANPRQWAVAAEWITVLQALLDVQGFCRGAQWMGFVPNAVDPAPASIDRYLWIRSDGAVMKTILGVATVIGGAAAGVLIADEGTNIPATPHDRINFAGAGVLVTNAGGGTALVTIPGGGVELIEQPQSTNGPSPSMQFQALGITPSGSRVYVGSQGGPEAWRFLTATNLWDTIPPAAIPLDSVRQFVFDPTGAKMYVLLQSDLTTIYIVDTATNTIIGTPTGLPVAGFYYSTMAIQPGTGELWAHYDTGPNFIARVNTTTDTYITSFTAATGNAYDMCFNPSGTKMYYVGADTLGFGPKAHIYDATTYTLITSINDTPLWRCAVPLGNGTEVWFGRDGVFPAPEEIIRVDTTTDAIVGVPILSSQSNSSGPYRLKAKSDSSKVYALLTTGDIDVITVGSLAVTNTILMSGDFAGDMVIHPANTFLYASKSQGVLPYWVKVINLTTELVVATITGASVAQPSPVSVGTFNDVRIPGVDIVDDGGGQATVTLPVIFDTSVPPLTNIKANRPFPASSQTDQTKTGITNFGGGSLASGENATIGGGVNNLASGDASAIPGGDGNKATGYAAFAMGGSEASGDYAVAMGGSIARGEFSTAFGESLAEGYAAISGGECGAPGDYSLSMGGYGSDASGEASTALGGFGQTATGLAAFACGGYGSLASGDGSFAANEGWSDGENSASFSDSKTEGYGAFAEGAGKAIGQYSHAEGNDTESQGNNSHAEGDTTVAKGTASHAEGSNTSAEGSASHAEGNASVASDDYAHAEGNSTTASGQASHAEGAVTEASGQGAHAEGVFTVATGRAAHAEGESTLAIGEKAHAEGDNTTAVGWTAHAQGLNAYARGDGEYAHASGPGTTATGLSGVQGGSQNRVMEFTGETPGAGAGESVELDFGYITSSNKLVLGNPLDDMGYTVIVTAIARGKIAGVYKSQSFRQMFSVLISGGVATLEASGALEQIGSVAAVSWTLTASIAAAPTRLRFDFSTGATTSNARVSAKVEVAEIYNPL